MAELWDAFLEDYPKEQFFDYQLKFILELFWHYCQDGSRAVDRILKSKEEVNYARDNTEGI